MVGSKFTSMEPSDKMLIEGVCVNPLELLVLLELHST